MTLDLVSGLTCRLLDERERAVFAMVTLSQNNDLKMCILIIILSTDFTDYHGLIQNNLCEFVKTVAEINSISENQQGQAQHLSLVYVVYWL